MVQSLTGYVDLILVPIYFILFFIIARIYKRKHPDDPLVQKYFVPGLVFKVTGGLIYALLVIYYWGFGDTATYFLEVLEFRQLLSEGKINLFQVFFHDYSFFKENFGLVRSINNNGFMVTKIAILFSYFSFSRFLITTMLFSGIAFSSLFILFRTFVSFVPKWHMPVALFVLFFPSISIYGSGILKDTVCITSLGYFFYSSYNIVIRKNLTVKNFIVISISAYLIIAVKSYILAAFILPFFIFFIVKIVSGLKPLFRILSILLICAFTGIIVYIFFEPIEDLFGKYSTENLVENIQSLQNEYGRMRENADSNFSLGEIDPSITGIIMKMPAGFVATLYRPFIWEAQTVFALFSALESLTIMMFTIYVLLRAGVLNFLKYLFSDSMVFLFLVFSIIFASIVGLSALNFGTLARYRIPVIPFYLMGLLLVLYKAKSNKDFSAKG